MRAHIFKLFVFCSLCIFQLAYTNEEVQAVKADLVVYSYDRPLQLYAFLESISNYVSGLNVITVIYRTSSDDFQQAYQKVQKNFSHVIMQKQSSNPQADFKQLTINAVYNNCAKYIIFAVDDIIVTDYIDLSASIALLEKYNAYGFYYRLGKNLSECYSFNCKMNMPLLDEVEPDVFAWKFSSGLYDWNYPHTVDMTLYKKNDITPFILELVYHTPNSLEGCWASKTTAIKNRCGLCCGHTKIVNVPLNLVQKEWPNRNMNLYTPDQLLQKFNDGEKIDIYDLYKIENKAAHMNYKPKFVSRNNAFHNAIDFDLSMGKNDAYFNTFYETCLISGSYYTLCTNGKPATQLLDFFRSLYVKNSAQATRSHIPGIPEIVHMVWLGKEFPEKFHNFRQSWIDYHPQWTHILWVDNPENYKHGQLIEDVSDLKNKLLTGCYAGKKLVIDVRHFKLYNQKYYDESHNFGEKSDLFRYEALYEYGGLYADVDFECLKPFNELNRQYDFYCGIQPLDVNALALNIALMGTIAQHPILKDCIETIKDDRQWPQVFIKTGPVHFTKSFWRTAADENLRNIALPATFFFPLGMSQNRNMPHIIKKESYAVHWWAGSWL